MATIKENVYRAIRDFNSIKEVIETNGVEVNTAPTEQYKNLIEQLLEKNKGPSLDSFIDRSITEVIIPPEIPIIGEYAFANCTQLANIDFELFDNQKKVLKTNCLQGTAISSIDLTKIEILGTNACQECHSLKELIIPEGCTIQYGGFNHCQGLEKITIQKNSSIFDYAFNGCSNLKTVSLEEGVLLIHVGMFQHCGFESIFLPESCVDIYTSGFYGCSTLQSVHLSSQHKSIDHTAFSHCTSLKAINLPASIVSISPNTFMYCSALEFIDMEQGFNANGLNLSVSHKFSVDTLINILEALADRTGDTAYTLTLGAVNLDKLTEEQKNIALNKNWILA